MGLNPDLVRRGENLQQIVIVEPLRQGHGHPGADADHVDVWNGGQMREEKLELFERQGQRIATGDDHVVDFGVIANVLDHAMVVSRDRVPAPSFHGRSLARAKATVHGANMRCHEQGPVGVAVGQPRDRRVLVLVERIVLAVDSRGAGKLHRRRNRLQADRVERVEAIN